MPKKKITIDDLARMVKEGFDETARKDELAALRGDVDSLSGDVGSFQKWTMRRFDAIDTDLKTIKKHLTGVVYRNEFEKLETRVKDIEDLLAVATKRR